MRRFSVMALVSIAVLQTLPVFAGPGDVAGQRSSATGTLQGITRTSAGQTLANHPLQVRDLASGKVAGRATSDETGSFNVGGLAPGTYVVEPLNASGVVVGISAPLAVGSQPTRATSVPVSVAAARIPESVAGAASVASSAARVAVAARTARVPAVLVTGRDPSPSR